MESRRSVSRLVRESSWIHRERATRASVCSSTSSPP
jgi:hypothetical protein